MARLTKSDLANKARFTFTEEEVELPELGGGSVLLRGLSVEEENRLTELIPTDEEGRQTFGSDEVAAIVAAAVVEPSFTLEEAKEFISGWPSSALGRIVDKFTEMTGASEGDRAATEFRGS